MEHKQFISDALNRSPQPNLSFQADKFTKKLNFLSIPDTIHEQSSAELSGDSLKTEANENIGNDEKENISSNRQVICNESSNNSKIFSIDNSFIKNCERKLLENSNSDETGTEGKLISEENKLLDIPRKLLLNNDSISTPPSALRKEISILRSELAATEEFHDIEIQLLKEEKSVTEVDLKKYLEVLEKNAELVELYTALKNEYDEYRREQEKMKHELQSKTADCLESLCSQIEASDSSLNFSTASFVSFNGGVKSSTLLEDVSEVEATVMHDGTVLATDPLSITCEAFKTPLQTPMRSAKKLFPQELNSTRKTPVVKEIKEIIDKRESITPFDSEYNIQLLNLETALYDKAKQVENLEQRLFKVEDMSGVLKSECERMKESLFKKTEELNELTQKLFTETVLLNPALKDTLTGVSGAKLLVVFFETIMESCKNIQNELIMKHKCEKAEWEAQRQLERTANESLQEQVKSLSEGISSQLTKLTELEEVKVNLEKQLTDAESTILTREVEMRILQSSVRQAQEDFTSTAETLAKLESQLSACGAEKKGFENRCNELEENIKKLKDELETKEKLPSELDATKSALENAQRENEDLKQKIQQCEELMVDLKSESIKKVSDAENTILSKEEEIHILQSDNTKVRKDLNEVAEALSKLQQQLSSAEAEKESVESRCHALEETVQNLKNELALKEKLLPELQTATTAIETLPKENEDLKHMIQVSEETIARLQSESLQSKEFNAKLIEEVESLKSKAESRLNPLFEALEECNRSLTDTMSTALGEISAFDLFFEKLDRCSDPKLLSTVKAVMEFIKKDWESKRAFDLTEIESLHNQIKTCNEKANQSESKLSQILAKNDEFNKLCENLKVQLREAEDVITSRDAEITKLKRQEDVLEQLKGDLALLDEVETSELPTDRIEKLITQRTSLLDSAVEGEAKVASVFIETLTKTCKGVENEFVKRIESKRVEWETQRNDNLILIDNLQKEIKELKDKAQQQETRIAEMNSKKEELEKERETMTSQMIEARTVISTSELALKQAKDELSVAYDTILTLKSELSSAESTKEAIETRCKELERSIEELKRSLDSSENLHNETKSTLETVEKENKKLKEIIAESEKAIDRLKSEQNNEELLREMETLKRKENERFAAFLEILEDSKKIFEEETSSPEGAATGNAAFRLISERLADSQLLSVFESVADFVKIEWNAVRNEDVALIENLQNQIKSLSENSSELRAQISELLDEKTEAYKSCEDAKHRLRETENRLSLQEAEIVILKKKEEVLNEMKDAIALADETISKLNTQLSLIEDEKKEIESQRQRLEGTVKNLKDELEAKEKLLTELQAIIESVRGENDDLKQKIEHSEQNITESLLLKEELVREIESLKNKEASRFDALFKTLEECKNSVGDSALTGEKIESTGSALFSEKLNNCSDTELLSAVKAVMELAEKDCDLRRKADLRTIDNLRNQMKAFTESKNEFEELKIQLREAEDIITSRDAEIAKLKRQEDILEQLKGDLALLDEVETSELPTDRIEKLITQRTNLLDSAVEGEAKVASVFIETLTKTCKGVENEFVKRIESKRVEWETQRNDNLILIDNLQKEIKELKDKAQQQETRIAEMNSKKEELEKERETMTNEMIEARNVISTCNEEIRILRTHEATLKQTKEELAVADGTIETLKSQLVTVESEKVEIEVRCQELEEGAVKLKAEIDTKDTIIQGLDELKVMRERTENENGELKQQILQSEDVIVQLRKGLEAAKEEQNSKEMRIKSLVDEVDLLRREKDKITEFSKKLEKLEKSNRDLMDIFSDVQSHLNLPDDTLMKLLSGNIENKKIFTEKMNNLVKTQTEGLKVDNKNLKLSNEMLKDKVKQLSKLLCESANADMKEELSSLNVSQVNSMTLRSRSSKNMDLCVRRLDKLEDINHNLTELLMRILTMTEFPDLEKLKLCSVRDYPNITKKVVAHIGTFQSKVKEMKEENAQLDEECETYSNIIKDLKKEAVNVWRENKEKTEAMEAEISRLKEEKSFWENEKQELVAKISKLENECQKLKSTPKSEGSLHTCNCGNDFKKVSELKRTILIKEQKLLELQDLEVQATSFKSQVEYLKSALEREKKKVSEEKEKNKKLQNELNEAAKSQKGENKKPEQNEVLEELRMRGTISGGVVQEFVDKEKIRKLSKDIGILKEMCRARYAEIKRLEAVNASLRNSLPNIEAVHELLTKEIFSSQETRLVGSAFRVVCFACEFQGAFLYSKNSSTLRSAKDSAAGLEGMPSAFLLHVLTNPPTSLRKFKPIGFTHSFPWVQHEVEKPNQRRLEERNQR